MCNSAPDGHIELAYAIMPESTSSVLTQYLADGRCVPVAYTYLWSLRSGLLLAGGVVARAPEGHATYFPCELRTVGRVTNRSSHGRLSVLTCSLTLEVTSVCVCTPDSDVRRRVLGVLPTLNSEVSGPSRPAGQATSGSSTLLGPYPAPAMRPGALAILRRRLPSTNCRPPSAATAAGGQLHGLAEGGPRAAG
jgi:hypothetical protein